MVGLNRNPTKDKGNMSWAFDPSAGLATSSCGCIPEGWYFIAKPVLLVWIAAGRSPAYSDFRRAMDGT